MSLDTVLSAEGTDVSGVLGDFHLLDLLSEGGTITSTVFTGHTDLCAVVSFGPALSMHTAIDSLFVRFVMLASLNEENWECCECWCRCSIDSRNFVQGHPNHESAVLAPDQLFAQFAL